jgi:hypothetical protein
MGENMSNPDNLVPVPIPPLATVLAYAERTKGSRLSESEVETLRDECVCIMMQAADAEALAEKRGFIDVNPENCWADWHRLRVEMTGDGYLPKIILCIPGDDGFAARCEPILKAQNVEHELRPHDPNLLRAFQAASSAWPSLSEEDFARIDQHTTGLYVLSENFTAAAAPAASRRFLELGRRLLEAGGIAIKSESSGIAHSRAR